MGGRLAGNRERRAPSTRGGHKAPAAPRPARNLLWRGGHPLLRSSNKESSVSVFVFQYMHLLRLSWLFKPTSSRLSQRVLDPAFLSCPSICFPVCQPFFVMSIRCFSHLCGHVPPHMHMEVQASTTSTHPFTRFLGRRWLCSRLRQRKSMAGLA